MLPSLSVNRAAFPTGSLQRRVSAGRKSPEPAPHCGVSFWIHVSVDRSVDDAATNTLRSVSVYPQSVNVWKWCLDEKQDLRRSVR
ncbi:hypothetical protein ABIB26_000039 [Arthrobacter sp. UYEF20]